MRGIVDRGVAKRCVKTKTTKRLAFLRSTSACPRIVDALLSVNDRVFFNETFARWNNADGRKKLTRTTILGIVGGIGSGKSFVSEAFVALGAVRFDADKEAKRLYERADFLASLRARWSNAFDACGLLDRGALARIVFDPSPKGREELDFLNRTFEPFLRVEYESWFREVRAQKVPLAVLDAPLLFERGWNAQTDYVVFVDASLATRLRRVAARGWNRDELERREACQFPLDFKKERSDFVVNADFDESRVPEQLAKIIEQICPKSGGVL